MSILAYSPCTYGRVEIFEEELKGQNKEDSASGAF